MSHYRSIGRHTGAALRRFASVLTRPPYSLQSTIGRHTGAALRRFASVLTRPPYSLQSTIGRRSFEYIVHSVSFGALNDAGANMNSGCPSSTSVRNCDGND